MIAATTRTLVLRRDAALPRLVTAVRASALAPGAPTTVITTSGANRSMATGPAYDDMEEHLTKLKLGHSKSPAPYTDGLPILPVDPDTFDQQHKKVTVVGCGQVGMAIAVSQS
jgi:hypothetical protein